MLQLDLLLQIAGLYKAVLWGVVGLAAGGQLGIHSASRGAYCLARLTPGFMMAAMLFPRLQVQLRICHLAARKALLYECAIPLLWLS